MKSHSHKLEHFENTFVEFSEGRLHSQARISAPGLSCCLMMLSAFGLVNVRDLLIVTGC